MRLARIKGGGTETVAELQIAAATGNTVEKLNANENAPVVRPGARKKLFHLNTARMRTEHQLR